MVKGGGGEFEATLADDLPLSKRLECAPVRSPQAPDTELFIVTATATSSSCTSYPAIVLPVYRPSPEISHKQTHKPVIISAVAWLVDRHLAGYDMYGNGDWDWEVNACPFNRVDGSHRAVGYKPMVSFAL